MDLSGQQRKELKKAFIDAFPDKASLEQMLSFELEKNLDAITGGGSLENIVFYLIKTAASQGWILELIHAANKVNPGNVRLKAIAEQLLQNNYLETPAVSLPNIHEKQQRHHMSYYDVSNTKFGGGFAGTGGTQSGGTFYDYSSNPNLTEAAAEIKQILQRLEATNSITTSAEKRAVVNKAIDEIENNRTFKAKVIAALKSSNAEAFRSAINHPLAKNMMPFLEELAEAN